MASELGLEALSIGALATSLKMSKSGLFAHFQSKDNLHLAILEEAMRRFQELVVLPALKKPRGEPRVRALFDYWIAWSQSDFLPGGCIFLTAAVELDDRPGPTRDFLAAAQGELAATLARAAHIAVDEGHFRPDLDTEQFAFEWYSMMMGSHFHQRMLRTPRTDERLRFAFERLISDAIGPRKRTRQQH